MSKTKPSSKPKPPHIYEIDQALLNHMRKIARDEARKAIDRAFNRKQPLIGFVQSIEDEDF